MFIGHFAVGFASKKIAPKVGLPVLFLAPVWLDVLWPLFLGLGWEHASIEPGHTVVTPLNLYDYPFSHSLLMTMVWSVLFGGIYFLLKKDRIGSIVLGVGVFSHWILDFITHGPDMPIGLKGPYVGLGLWNSLWGTLIVEVSIYLLAVAIYARATRPKDKTGTWAFISLVVFFIILYAANIFGPPPPDIGMVIKMTPSMIIFFIWAWWADRHREAVVQA